MGKTWNRNCYVELLTHSSPKIVALSFTYLEDTVCKMVSQSQHHMTIQVPAGNSSRWCSSLCLCTTICGFVSFHLISLGGLGKFRTIVRWYGIRWLPSQRAFTISSALVPRPPDCPRSCSLGAHGWVPLDRLLFFLFHLFFLFGTSETLYPRAAVCVPLRSYKKGKGIVIPITQTKLWEREGNWESQP